MTNAQNRKRVEAVLDSPDRDRLSNRQSGAGRRVASSRPSGSPRASGGSGVLSAVKARSKVPEIISTAADSGMRTGPVYLTETGPVYTR